MDLTSESESFLRATNVYYNLTPTVDSEIGAYALGGALSDSGLFELCLQFGDPSGSLRFFVSTAPNRPPTRNEPDYPVDNNHHSSRYYRTLSDERGKREAELPTILFLYIKFSVIDLEAP
ncbi:hypothetical protein J3R30DRAFT_3409355 [Lentinula aciculospora]|uniref:Uncharacterized protein n=1 Tax=Lentinula aciculospora TaxID=153920 RepID=A0A9W9DHP0_9AGAR|nr:hypothetical protein J3R30DRAFT_3409355 [Lentinula aciculospora]